MDDKIKVHKKVIIKNTNTVQTGLQSVVNMVELIFFNFYFKF